MSSPSYTALRLKDKVSPVASDSLRFVYLLDEKTYRRTHYLIPRRRELAVVSASFVVYEPQSVEAHIYALRRYDAYCPASESPVARCNHFHSPHLLRLFWLVRLCQRSCACHTHDSCNHTNNNLLHNSQFFVVVVIVILSLSCGMMSLSPYTCLYVSVTFRHSAVAGVSETEQAFAMSVCAPHCLCRLSFAKVKIKYHSRKMISLNLHREKPKRCRLFPIVGLTARRHTYEHMIRGWSKTDGFVL